MPLLLQTETGTRAVSENDSDYVVWRDGGATIYVRQASDGGDDSNSGFSANDAVATWNGVATRLRKLNTGGSITVRFGTGTWNAFDIHTGILRCGNTLGIRAITGAAPVLNSVAVRGGGPCLFPRYNI